MWLARTEGLDPCCSPGIAHYCIGSLRIVVPIQPIVALSFFFSIPSFPANQRPASYHDLLVGVAACLGV